MYQHPGGYQPQPPNTGFNRAAGYTGPPPAKKPKSNPIITRYPPPPGYRGPAQPHQPFQHPTWQPPAQGYGYGQPAYQGYPQPAWGAPQPYQPPQWQGQHQQVYPSAGFQPPQGYPPTQNYQQPNSAYPVPTAAWQAPASAPTVPPPQPWQPPPTAFQQNKRRHNSAPFPNARNSSIGPMDGNGDPFPPMDPTTSTSNSLEEDFDEECYFARHPDEINPDLSLGMIEWQAALPTKMALPSTFAEAELEAMAPRKPRPADEESISDYFTKDKRDDAFLSVRQTEVWQHVKDDVIYREFSRVATEILSMSEIFEKYRDRPDPAWTASAPANTANPTPNPSRNGTPLKEDPGSTGMDIDIKANADYVKLESSSECGDMLGNLEQALNSDHPTNGQWGAQRNGAGGQHSRAPSVSSRSGERITRPQPLAPVRDKAQEEILAALGVTGSPKMVYQTPGPAIGSAPPQQITGAGANGRQNSLPTNHAGFHPSAPPPPTTAQRTSSFGGRQNGDGNGGAVRPISANSQHSAAGSDVDPDATPRPKFDRRDTRKRSHGEYENGSLDSRTSHTDGDATPTQRPKHARVDGPSDRRW